MAAREASLKVTLKTGSFASGVNSMKGMVKEAGRHMGEAISEPMKKGFHEAKDSLREMGRSFKEIGGEIAGIGGGIGIGLFVEDAVKLEAQAGKVAMKLRHIGEAAGDVGAPLDTAREAAEKFKATTGEMLTAYEILLDKTADPIFSEESLETVALMQNAFRMTTDESSQFVASLHEQHIGAKVIRDEILPAMLDLTNRGGAGMEEIAGASGKIVKLMTAVGAKGKAGFGEVVGMLNLTKEQGGSVEDRLSGIGLVMLGLTKKSNLTHLSKELGGMGSKLKPTNTALENMQELLSKKGGLAALQQQFGKSQKTASVFNTMVQPYVDALNESAKQGKSSKEIIRIASEALAKAFKKSTETTSTAADVQNEAAIRSKEKSRVIELAIDKMKDAFTNPQILGAIDRLAANLPALAEKVADFVAWVADNPGEAAATMVLGRVALAFAGGALEAVIEEGMKKIFSRAAAAAMADSAVGIGTSASGGLLKTGAAAAVGGTAMVAGALAAGVVGYEAGTAFFNRKGGMGDHQRGEADAMRDAELTTGQTSQITAKSTPAKVEAALAALEAAKQNVENSKSTTNTVFGDVASAVTLGGVKSPQQERADSIKQITDEEERLKAALASLRGSAEKLGGALDTVTKGGRGGTTRGPMNAPAPRPGAAPAGG